MSPSVTLSSNDLRVVNCKKYSPSIRKNFAEQAKPFASQGWTPGAISKKIGIAYDTYLKIAKEYGIQHTSTVKRVYTEEGRNNILKARQEREAAKNVLPFQPNKTSINLSKIVAEIQGIDQKINDLCVRKNQLAHSLISSLGFRQAAA